MSLKFKKIILLIITISLIAGMLGMSQSALATAGTFRTTGRVNVRAEPTTDSAALTVVDSGGSVEVLEHNPAGWSRVQVGNTTGFIRSDFLRFPIGDTSATFRTTGGVNLRESATTDSNVLRTIAAGTSVEVSEHDPAGWSSVNVSGVSGFIRSDFLTRGGSSGDSGGSTPGSSDQVIATLRTTSTVNLRSGPSTSHSIVRTLSANTSVDVLENANGWSRVKHSNTVGFIRSDFLSESGSSATTTLRTVGTVNMRSGPSTSHEIVKSLAAGTSVEVVEQQTNGWSSVRHGGTSGFIRSDLLTSGTGGSSSVIATLRTVTGVNFRTGPSTDDDIIRLLPVNTSVDVLENLSNGWSRVRHNNTEGFIRSDLLGSGTTSVELVDWSSARNIIPTGVNLRTVDVRTGITFTLRGFSKSGHIDVEPVTKEDTEAILRSRNGVWAWAPRPVWVTVGGRTFAAAINGMPHDVSTISDNGMDGHICMHFNNTVTNSQSYQRDLNNAVVEAYNARPR